MSISLIICAVIVLAWLSRFAVRFHAHRRHYASLPGPPHSYWFGHLKIVDQMLKELPPSTHMQMVVAHMGHRYGLKDAWYIDMWPAAPPMMAIANPDIAQQLTVTNNMPKHPENKAFLRGMTGDKGISTLEGKEWKDVRAVLMPTYAPSHVLSQVPMMLQHISIMCDRLTSAAEQGSIVRLHDFFIDVAIDIIGHATIGINLNAQTTGSPIAHAFKKSVKLAAEQLGDPLAKYRKAIQFWWYTRQITNEVQKVIVATWRETTSEKAASKTSIDLAFEAIRDGNPTWSPTASRTLDGEALSITTDQVKSLILGGHDTSSAVLSYIICLLSQHPEALARIRKEHSKLLPPSASREEAISILNSNLTRINDLAYTTAVIKETLRLFPTSSTARVATRNSPIQSVKNPNNLIQELPLGISSPILWIAAYLPHHNPDYFCDPYDFIPDRFISDSEYARAHPFPSSAFRPFEKGPRACIGMELAMVEMRLVLIMFLREFDVEVAYAKDAPRAPESLGGMVWYQTMEFAAKPIGGLPVKLMRRKRDGSDG